MIPDPMAVITAIRQVAAEELVPRFRRLSQDEVNQKAGPQDLVTVADLEAERRLSIVLRRLLPGSTVVGEEGTEDDPDLLAALGSTRPAWLVDPVDGTNNFVHGRACFAVIVGLVVESRTLAGWIHDPLADATAWALAGEGAWQETPAGRIRLRASFPRPVDAMTGSVGHRLGRRLTEDRDAGIGDGPRRLVRYGCTGREYMDLAAGKLHFAHYRRLKPWDHAAGVLIHHEAGGYARIAEDRTPYRPLPAIREDTLLLAPDETAWETLREVLG